MHNYLVFPVENQIHIYQFYIEDSIYNIFTVFEGEALPEFPTPEITYADFHSWVSEDGSFPDHTAPVYSDMAFHAYIE